MSTPVRTVERGAVAIAYQITGHGSAELLVLHDFAGHLDLDWELPGAARLFERLGSFARVVRFDKRGTGLSARGTVVVGPAADAEDALAVLDAVGVERPTVFAWGDAVPTAVLLAARHPERVAGLVLFGGAARPSPPLFEAFAAAERVQETWGVRMPDGFAAAGDSELERWWTGRARAAASPAAARALVLTAAQADVNGEAGLVSAPTLVLHRGGDRVVPAERGRALAAAIPGARFVELPGAAHLPYVDPDQIADQVEAFVSGRPPRSRREQFDAYELEHEIGRGGMGTVHLATDRRLGRRVALKLLPPEAAGDEVYRERFLQEQRIAASLEHPAVVPIYDAGEADGRLYLAMRYIDGSDLRRIVEADGALDPLRAVQIVTQVADALDAAHERGLVHRDVKPANVLLDDAGHAYLCDFGLTKETSSQAGLTAAGQLVGTLDYLAPEQIRREDVDARADVYALGCVLYECLTGRPPFGGRTEAQTLWGHVQEEAVPPTVLRPGLPPAVDAVVARALAKEPDDRYRRAGDLAADAQAAVGLIAPLEVRRRRARAAIAAGAALLLAVALAAAYELTRGGGSVTVVPGSVAVLDDRTGKLLGDVPVGHEPTDVAYARGAVWATSAEDETLTRIDGRRRRQRRTIGVGTDAGSVAVAGRSVWVGGVTQGVVVRVDPTFDAVRERIPLLSRNPTIPSQVYALAGRGNLLWVAAGWGGVVGIDAALARVVHVGPLPAVTDVAVGAGSVWALTSTSLVRLDPATAKPTGHLRLPSAYAIAFGSGALWVADVGGGVRRVDPRTLAVGRRAAAGARARNPGPFSASPGIVPAAAIAAGNGSVWIASADGTLARIDSATSRVVTKVHVAGRPSAIAVGGGAVWVAVQAPRGA